VRGRGHAAGAAPASGAGGFSLVEGVVALVLLQVVLLGSSALLVTAVRTRNRAIVLERALERATLRADSLLQAGGGSGEEVLPGAHLRWELLPDDWGVVEILPPGGTLPPLLVLELRG
jgi:type II secretory pathway pseudopilin PulG